ncbi:MAG TPA: NAD(P)-dependent oxidoreductase, partial [Alphaproteobacteria bacterium]|nr:NAD(P)-dependent oxidoreductase [Alphaproteobacteria bacterium]
MKTPVPHLFCFGLGFSGQALARLALARGWKVSGTVRSEAKAARLREQGINALVLDTDAADRLSEDVSDAIRRSTHLLQSVGTARSGDDPVLPLLTRAAEVMSTDWAPYWFGYLSTTVVYGDWQGAWVSEDSETRSTSTR